jgi:hypothetical protein
MKTKKIVKVTKGEIMDRPNDMMLGAYVRKKLYEENSWIKKLKKFFTRN